MKEEYLYFNSKVPSIEVVDDPPTPFYTLPMTPTGAEALARNQFHLAPSFVPSDAPMRTGTTTVPNPVSFILPIVPAGVGTKRLSKEEESHGWRNNLCFKCNEKWWPEHK